MGAIARRFISGWVWRSACGGRRALEPRLPTRRVEPAATQPTPLTGAAVAPRAKIYLYPLSPFHKLASDARPRDAETRYARGALRHEAPSSLLPGDGAAAAPMEPCGLAAAAGEDSAVEPPSCSTNLKQATCARSASGRASFLLDRKSKASGRGGGRGFYKMSRCSPSRRSPRPNDGNANTRPEWKVKFYSGSACSDLAYLGCASSSRRRHGLRGRVGNCTPALAVLGGVRSRPRRGPDAHADSRKLLVHIGDAPDLTRTLEKETGPWSTL